MTIIVVGDENCICSEHRRLQLPPSWESRTRVELNLAQEVNIWGKPSTPPPAVYHQQVHWTELFYIVCWDHVRRSAAQYNATLVELSRKWQVRYHRGRLSLCCIAQWNYKLHRTVELCCTAMHSGTTNCIALHCKVELYIALNCIVYNQCRWLSQQYGRHNYILHCNALHGTYITSSALH